MIKSLTSLRGIFILFIFFHHCLNLYPGGGTMAVTFFFVLGGFSMTLGYKDRVMMPEFSYREYIKRRYIKFLPLHWITLLLAIPLTLLSFSWILFPALFLNAFLLQTWIPIKDIYFSYNWVSWYLADTMFMTMMFPLVFKFIAKSSNKGKICIAACFAILYITIVILLPVEDRHAILYICPYMRLTDFVFGIFLALGYQKYKDTVRQSSIKGVVYQTITIISTILLVSLSCVLSKEARMIAPYYWPLVAITIVAAALSNMNGGGILLENKLLFSLGKMSFTIFLTHQLVLRYTTQLFDKVLHLERGYIYVVMTLALTIIVSILIDRYFLNSITQWLRKRTQPSMTVQS